jgi:two-component system, chemotaxis family, response regulator Rcp1
VNAPTSAKTQYLAEVPIAEAAATDFKGDTPQRMNGRSVPAQILLVEDNPGDVRLMREALKMRPVETHLAVAEDGEQAVRYLRREHPFNDAPRPDLIFLDLNLPRRDGREVLAEIKADASLRRIPVIVLTTSEAEGDVHRMYELHANCYIRKPPDLDEYLEVIQACEKFWLEIVRLPLNM